MKQATPVLRDAAPFVSSPFERRGIACCLPSQPSRCKSPDHEARHLLNDVQTYSSATYFLPLYGQAVRRYWPLKSRLIVSMFVSRSILSKIHEESRTGLETEEKTQIGVEL